MGARRKPDHAAEARRRQAAAERQAAAAPEPAAAAAAPQSALERWYAEDHAQRAAQRQADEHALDVRDDLVRVARALADLDERRSRLLAERDGAVERALGLGWSMRHVATLTGTTRQALLKRREPAGGAS